MGKVEWYTPPDVKRIKAAIPKDGEPKPIPGFGSIAKAKSQ